MGSWPVAQAKTPNAVGFYDDDRERTEKAFWNPKSCMSDCCLPVKITGHAQAVDVTPDDKTQKRGAK
jgi:cytochrome c